MVVNNNRYFEVTRVRGVVSLAATIRLTHLKPTQQPYLRAIFSRLPPEWDVVDGDVITFKEVT